MWCAHYYDSYPWFVRFLYHTATVTINGVPVDPWAPTTLVQTAPTATTAAAAPLSVHWEVTPAVPRGKPHRWVLTVPGVPPAGVVHVAVRFERAFLLVDEFPADTGSL